MKEHLNKRSKIFNIMNYLFFSILIIVMIYPFWYVLMFSFSETHKINVGMSFLLPAGFTLSNYVHVMKESLIYTGLKNSIFITAVGTFISLLFTACTAYPLSRQKFGGKKILFALIVFTMIFNGGIIPTYLVVKSFGLINSIWVYIFPYTINVFHLLVMMRFFKNIHPSIIESAFIDGQNDIGILFYIILPMSKAALAAVGLFYAVLQWNAFLPGLLYITDSAKFTLQIVLINMINETKLLEQAMVSERAFSPEVIRMTTVIVSLVPILSLYPFLQKHFAKGVMLGAVKG